MMNKLFRHSQLTPYERDYARWCEEQGALFRAGRFEALDRENLAEEIECLGRSDRYENESRLNVLLVRLIKLRCQPERQSGSWRASIREQRARVARRIKDSPSLAAYPASVLAEEYELARGEAAEETGLPEAAFPSICPFTIEQVLDPDFWPEPAR